MKFLNRKHWEYSTLFSNGPPSPLLRSPFSLPSVPAKLAPRLLVAAVAMLFVVSMVLLPNNASRIPGLATCGSPTPAPSKPTIPNQVHYVHILPNTDGNFAFEFSHFLSIYATWLYWRPEAMFLHTNVFANSTAVKRARDGEAGKWNKYIFRRFDLKINKVDVPTRTRKGKEIQPEHAPDFVRVKAVHDFGGVYVDWDVHPLRDIRWLRESGFKAVAGRQLGGQINGGLFMSEKGGRAVKQWMEEMHEAYTGASTAHSNGVMTRYGEKMVGEPGEMLIMERDAFSPGSWHNDDMDGLFAVHADEPSSLVNETLSEETTAPPWARDWSHSYVLHAFSPERWKHGVDGFAHITPRYVLERRSNFARAVYPAARHLHKAGLIAVQDTHLGYLPEH